MANVQHNVLSSTDIHEPKGVDTAAANKVYVPDGAGSGAWKTITTMGWENYDDTATTGTPIPLTLADTDYIMTNDTLGPVTNTGSMLPNNTTMWNASTNRFDFTSLNINDYVNIRIDLNVNTGGNNHELLMKMNFAVGGSSPFSLNIQQQNIKTITNTSIVRYVSFFIGSTDIKDNPASLTMRSSNTGDTVVVNGWLIRTSPLNPVYT
ncbi:MAG: hypothetical protein JKY50_00100 [Oleispira sp.]|nr:hypothetical protein [Oleispira sp.]